MKAAILGLALLLSGCWSLNYLAKQGLGQLELLHSRRRVADVLADPTVSADTKSRLTLAMEARQFGIDVLGLHGGASFTRYIETYGAPIAWNVSAAPKDRLEPYYNRFPIVGAIPYLGFFHEADARREEARLRARGLDTYVREVAGYSTLGIMADPIYSSMLEGPPARIVEVVLHEMLHGTVFLAGRAEWNESFATFVGLHGAAAFFAARGDPASAEALFADARRRQNDEQAFAQFLAPIESALESLYASTLSRAVKLERREAIFEKTRVQFLERFHPPPGSTPGFLREPLNNAVILAYAVYHRSTPEHERLYQRVGGDLGALIRLYKHAVEDEDDPIGYLHHL